MFCPVCVRHQGPILTVANWSGQWPGLVGLLNLNGSLVKAGKPFSSIWSKDFTDAYFQNALDRVASRRQASRTIFRTFIRSTRANCPPQARNWARSSLQT